MPPRPAPRPRSSATQFGMPTGTPTASACTRATSPCRRARPSGTAGRPRPAVPRGPSGVAGAHPACMMNTRGEPGGSSPPANHHRLGDARQRSLRQGLRRLRDWETIAGGLGVALGGLQVNRGHPANAAPPWSAARPSKNGVARSGLRPNVFGARWYPKTTPARGAPPQELQPKRARTVWIVPD